MQNKTKKYMYDLSFAFDLADHKILIPKLKVYGFDSNTLPHFRLLIYPQEKSVLIFEIPHSEIGADYEIRSTKSMAIFAEISKANMGERGCDVKTTDIKSGHRLWKLKGDKKRLSLILNQFKYVFSIKNNYDPSSLIR